MAWGKETPMAEKTLPEPKTEEQRWQQRMAEMQEAHLEAMRELARALKPQDELDKRGFTQAEKDAIKALPKPQRYRLIPWRSPDTGATGTANVVESKQHPNGRITQIIGYTHPREAYLTQDQGGHLPSGFYIWSEKPMPLPEHGEPEIGMFNNQFMQHRWEAYFKTDLRKYIGTGMTAACCAEPDGLKAPWVDSCVGKLEKAA